MGDPSQMQVFPPIDGERFSALAASFQVNRWFRVCPWLPGR